MGHAHFEHAHFLVAARELAQEGGPGQVTVASVTDRLKAPKGSFYYRFASRDLLLGELWLATALAYQEGFVAAIERGDGLAAALHMPAWVRRNLDDARMLLLYSRHDFVTGDWPEPLALGVADQARRFESCLERFAGLTWGGIDATSLRLSQFVLADAPLAAVRPHLQRREIPPALVDEIITITYRSLTIGRSTPTAGFQREPKALRPMQRDRHRRKSPSKPRALHQQPGGRPHLSTPIDFPTRMNVCKALSRSSGGCAADNCVLIRALPGGTTG